MKTRILIIIVLGITVTALAGFFLDDYAKTGYSLFTPTLTNESDMELGGLYFSLTVNEWKSMSKQQVMELYEKNEFDFGDLGKFLIKDAMEDELQKQGIQNEHDDFKVFQGAMLTSLPPFVDYYAVVNATDGKSYLLKGTTHSIEIRRVVISELGFEYEQDQQILEMEPKVTVVPPSANNARVLPHGLILDLDKNNIVTFYNNRTVPIKLEGQVEEGEQMTTEEKTWRIDFIAPGSYETIQFNRTGYYEYLVRTIEERPDVEGGAVVAYSDETNNLPFREKLRMAGEILHHSDLPLTSIGMGNNEGLRLGFTPAIFNSIPNAEEYYKKRAEQFIPFDVPIIIKGPVQPFTTG